jgi:predicted HAD superfamily Cof-like phosphohydrolase
MRDIAELHEAFDHPVRWKPVHPDNVNAESSKELQRRLMMRLRLVAEEFFELLEGAVGVAGYAGANIDYAKYHVKRALMEWGEDNDYNAINTADALTDLMVVIVGMGLELGIPLDRTWAEVHRSNMAKVGPNGKVTYREDGKVLKPEGWKKPDIRTALSCHIEAETESSRDEAGDPLPSKLISARARSHFPHEESYSMAWIFAIVEYLDSTR